MKSIYLFIALAVSTGAVCAADQIVAVKVKKLNLFAQPDDLKPVSQVEAAALPWLIKEERNAFFKVHINGKDVWVDSMQVNVRRDSADRCPPRANGPVAPDVNAAAPGAGGARCQ